MMTWNDFNSADDQNNFDLIPKGTLVKVRMTIKPGGYDDPNRGWTGGYATRNAETGSSWTKLDLRIDVGIPVFREDDRASVFLLVDNLTNLLNDNWGILRQHAFPGTIEEGTPEPRVGDASRYEIRWGIRYAF